MGHYDSCYASDYAEENKHKITSAQIEKLEKATIKNKGKQWYYWDDGNSALLAEVAKKSEILEVDNRGDGIFYIVLKKSKKKVGRPKSKKISKKNKSIAETKSRNIVVTKESEAERLKIVKQLKNELK